MSKTFLFKFLLAGTAVAVSVLWLLSMVMPEEVQFSWVLAVAIVSGVAGGLFILKGLFSKNSVGTFKKMNIIFGAGLLVVTLLAIVQMNDLVDQYVMPIIAIIATVAILLCVLAVGGKSWDTGDNQKVGYKNYHQRKADQEKKNKDN